MLGSGGGRRGAGMTDRSHEYIKSHKVAKWTVAHCASCIGFSVAYAVSVALTGSYAPAAFAQDVTADLDAVIVTARKREETLLEIPQEIQAISQQEMERANLRTSQDLERFIPSLSSNSNDAGLVSIFFRGVAEGTAGGFADSSAAIYLDEQPLT